MVADAIMPGLGQLVVVRDKMESMKKRESESRTQVCAFFPYRPEWLGSTSNHGYLVAVQTEAFKSQEWAYSGTPILTV